MKPTYEQLEEEVAKWKEKYPCCDGKPTCANNKLKKLCDDLLGDGEWTEKHEHLYSIIEAIETDRDMNKAYYEELKAENKSIALQLVAVSEAFEKIDKIVIQDPLGFYKIAEIMDRVRLTPNTIIAQMEKKMEAAIEMDEALKNLYFELVESNSPYCDEWSTPAKIIKKARALWNTANEVKP